MEDNLSHTPFHNLHGKRKTFEDQLERIKRAAHLAQQKIDYATAHNEHIVHAVDVVENFLRKRHRLCYGGQAINAHLPDKYKFYDPERTIPDYDFFTPNQEADLRILVQDLRKAGFTEISAREGMHEGTVKVYVDYVPVADMTAMDPPLYRILSKREYRTDGISYVDVHTLRMMMYLELSRPRGEVERWPKVYERLMLLNTFSAPRRCPFPPPASSPLTTEHTERILQWILRKQRVFAGLDLVNVYEHSFRSRKKKGEWLIRSRKPILFYSPTPEDDAKDLREIMQGVDATTPHPNRRPPTYRIQTYQKKGGGEILPTLTVLYQNKTPIVFLIHQTACHSYFQIPLSSNHSSATLRIASVDTLITLYFSIALLQPKWLDGTTMECLAHQLIQLSIQMRVRPNQSPFPFISLKCVGHQTTLPSLIRAKVKRMTERKKELKRTLEPTSPRRDLRKTVKRLLM